MYRGEFLGHGYVPGTGAVEIFQDLDSPDHLYILDHQDQCTRVARGKVIFTRSNTATVAANGNRWDELSKPLCTLPVPANDYEVPVDPHDGLDCDSCQ